MNQLLLEKLDRYISKHYLDKNNVRKAIDIDEMRILEEREVCHKEKKKPSLEKKVKKEIVNNPTLKDLLRNLDKSFSETVLTIIDEKGLEDVKVYHSAGLSKAVFSQLRSKKDYKPSKMTALAICLGLELNLGESNELLKRAGFTLSDSEKVDVVIRFCLVNRVYNIMTVNELLFQHDLPLFTIN